MNIYIPHHWLLEHLDTQASPDEIREYLSLCGPSVERIETREDEPVYDIEITTNRVDMMSVRGIAREAATILPEFGIHARLKPLPLSKQSTDLPPLDFKITNDDSLCHRILAVKLDHVSLGPSPDWLQKRLLQLGQRPLNNAIDITNYAMWELGHPIHAFDYDSLTEKTIIVREARQGEMITTLDNQTHTLKGGEVIFDDGTGNIVDLPGIMGTQNTTVTNRTTTILLWIESIVPDKIRYASMTHALRSQAAILNEKKVDPELALPTLERAMHLFTEITKSTQASQILDMYPHPPKPTSTSLTAQRIQEYMGISIPIERITRILENLGIQVEFEDTTFTLTPPTSRIHDLTIDADYIEEIARIYGYHNLNSVIMDTPIPDTPDDQVNFYLENHIKTILSGFGAQEVYSYSMVSKELAMATGANLDDHIEIKNPLSDDMVYMRQSLIPSLSRIMEKNPTAKSTIFELQNIYLPSKSENNLPLEQLMLSALSSSGYKVLKGMLDGLMEKIFLQHDYHIEPISTHALYTPLQVGHIVVNNTEVGSIGIAKSGFAAFEINYQLLKKHAHFHGQHLTASIYPSVIEDLTFVVPKNIHVGPLLSQFQSAHQLIESVKLAGIYHQNYTFTISYRSTHENLSTELVKPARLALVKVAVSLDLELVGQLSEE